MMIARRTADLTYWKDPRQLPTTGPLPKCAWQRGEMSPPSSPAPWSLRSKTQICYSRSKAASWCSSMSRSTSRS
eukprot:5925545-Pyramimonas_sp.AAC.1